MEDRVRGLGAEKEPKPIKLKPVNNIHVVAPQGALMLNNLFGTKFGCTMADGYYGEVDISTESLAKLQNLIQKFLIPSVGKDQSNTFPDNIFFLLKAAK